MNIRPREDAVTSVEFSDDGMYRWFLRREWDASLPHLAVIMLNPSTADERYNDPTVARIEGRATRWAFGGYTVYNLYAFRSTDPAALVKAVDPVGMTRNLDMLADASQSPALLLAWGAQGGKWARDFAATLPVVRQNLNPAMCLAVTGDGSPRHPLYVKNSAPPLLWRGYGVEPDPWPSDNVLDRLPALV